MGQFIIAEVNTDKTGTSDQLKMEVDAMKTKYRTIEEDHQDELEPLGTTCRVHSWIPGKSRRHEWRKSSMLDR